MDNNRTFGLGLIYKNHRLSHSRIIYEDEMDLINLRCPNSELMYVMCGRCNTWMTYYVEGYYICQDCGSKVFESTVYRKIDKENNDWLEKIEMDDVPIGCGACGGPYPDCMSSCKMYDE